MKSNCGTNVFFGTFVTFGRRSGSKHSNLENTPVANVPKSSKLPKFLIGKQNKNVTNKDSSVVMKDCVCQEEECQCMVDKEATPSQKSPIEEQEGPKISNSNKISKFRKVMNKIMKSPKNAKNTGKFKFKIIITYL